VYLESDAVCNTGVVYVAVDGMLAARITYADCVVPDAARTVQALQERGLRVYLMTGDTIGSARAVAKDVGIADEYASLLPQDKAELIESLKRRYGPVVMVGDNLNDVPAIAASTFGVVVPSASGMNLVSFYAEADAVVNDLGSIVYLVDLMRGTRERMHGVLRWSMAYNVVALSMASGVVVGAWVHP
jgi:P-type E1-E2 ATPase